MAKNKTTETGLSVKDFISAVKDDTMRKDSTAIAALMQEVTGFKPKMWGPSIVGFGSYHYRYDSGHEGDAPLEAFSPRASAISLYLASGFKEREALLKKFGKYKAAKACIYIKKLEDIDTVVLKQMVELSAAHIQKMYPG